MQHLPVPANSNSVAEYLWLQHHHDTTIYLRYRFVSSSLLRSNRIEYFQASRVKISIHGS